MLKPCRHFLWGFLFYLLFSLFSQVYAIELTTSPSGIDVWDNQIYLGKTPLELQLNNDSNIYLFSNIKMNSWSPYYRIIRLDTSLFSSGDPVHIDSPYCDNFFFNCDYSIVDVTKKPKGYDSFFYLNNEEDNFYNISYDMPYENFHIFNTDVYDPDTYIHGIRRLFISPDSRYIAFFKDLDPPEKNQRSIQIHELLVINPETKLPVFERVPTHHIRDSFSPGVDVAAFSPNSRWFSFCLTDQDSNCHFALIDLYNPVDIFTPVDDHQNFEECIWQKMGSKLACKWENSFFIYNVSGKKGETTRVILEKQFEITAIPTTDEFDYDDLYFAGNFVIWRWYPYFWSGIRREEIAIYNIQTDTLDKVFNDSRLAMITNDGRFIGTTADDLANALNRINLQEDVKQRLLEEDKTNDPKSGSIVYHLYNTETQTTVSKVLHNDETSFFWVYDMQKANFYQSKSEAFEKFLMNYPKDIVYSEDLFSSHPSNVFSDISNGFYYIDIVDDTIRIHRRWKLSAFDPETKNNLIFMLKYYGQRIPQENEQIEIETFFGFIEKD